LAGRRILIEATVSKQPNPSQIYFAHRQPQAPRLNINLTVGRSLHGGDKNLAGLIAFIVITHDCVPRFGPTAPHQFAGTAPITTPPTGL